MGSTTARGDGEEKINETDFFLAGEEKKENNGRVGEGGIWVCARFCLRFSVRHVSEGSGLVDTWEVRQKHRFIDH